MQHMGLAPGQDRAESAQAFSKALHDAWGVGDAQCNNGVLLLLSVGDRQVRFWRGSPLLALRVIVEGERGYEARSA